MLSESLVAALVREFGNFHGTDDLFIVVKAEVGAGALEEELDAELPAELIERCSREASEACSADLQKDPISMSQAIFFIQVPHDLDPVGMPFSRRLVSEKAVVISLRARRGSIPWPLNPKNSR